MDNQQESSTGLDGRVRWMTGMLEGDGHITIRFNRVGRAAKKAYVLTTVEFTNTDKAIIEEVVAICKGLGVNMYMKSYKQTPTFARRLTKWVCVTNRMKSAEPILRAMFPYLIGEKRQRADYMLKFIESRKRTLEGKHPGWHTKIPYTDEQVELVVACKHLVTPWKSPETIRAALLATQ